MHARLWAAGPRGKGRAGRPELVGEVLAGAAAKTPAPRARDVKGGEGRPCGARLPGSLARSPGAVGLSLDPVTHGELASGWGERWVLSPVTRTLRERGDRALPGPQEAFCGPVMSEGVTFSLPGVGNAGFLPSGT